MKIVTVAVALLILILGSGVAVMKAFEVGPFAPPAGSEQADAPPPVPAEPPRLVDVETLVVPVFVGDSVGGQILVAVKLETMGAENEEKIVRLLPRLSDAFYKDLYAFLPRLLRESPRLDGTVVSKRMQMVADKVVGTGVIQSVQIQSLTDGAPKDGGK